MSGIPLQTGIIYGPILSRRLGRSLGINLLSVKQKVCSFDCLYCQYGQANPINPLQVEEGFPRIDEILTEVEKALKKPRTIEYLTLSGNGEPTLHPDFPEIVDNLITLRNRLRPSAKLAIFSNASRVDDPHVLSALKLLDWPMMKLDAGDEQSFHAINRPEQSVVFDGIVNGLKRIPNLIIQSLLFDGEISNVRGEAFKAWVRIVIMLNPHEVHIYTVERSTADRRVERVQPYKLQKIAADLRTDYNLPIKAFC